MASFHYVSVNDEEQCFAKSLDKSAADYLEEDVAPRTFLSDNKSEVERHSDMLENDLLFSAPPKWFDQRSAQDEAITGNLMKIEAETTPKLMKYHDMHSLIDSGGADIYVENIEKSDGTSKKSQDIQTLKNRLRS